MSAGSGGGKRIEPRAAIDVARNSSGRLLLSGIAMLLSILTGLTAGAVHVVSGADHLVAMAPSSVHQPQLALKRGLTWGLGHSLGVVVLTLLAILVKDLRHIETLSGWAEVLVGISLLVVGGMAIRTAFGLDIHTHRHSHEGGTTHEHLHLHVGGGRQHRWHSHTASGLGLLHGLAGAGHLLAVIPALALPPLGAFSYLIAYLVGSLAAMTAFVLLMAIASARLGRRWLPSLVGCSGGLSIAIGIFWLQAANIPV